MACAEDEAMANPSSVIAAAAKPQTVSNPLVMSNPPKGGAVIIATDCSDCVSPSTTPCSSRGAAFVIKLVSAGRTKLPSANRQTNI